MSLFDAGDLLEHLITRRIALALVAGIVGAVAADLLLDPPLATRVAVLALVAGLVTGLVWEYRHRHDPDH
jgi:flagellar motor component MotA